MNGHTGRFRGREFPTGWWFELTRARDVVVVEWVLERGVWCQGVGPRGGPVVVAHRPVSGLPEPLDYDEAEQIAYRHLITLGGEVCATCHDWGWVCENHPDRAWHELTGAEPCCGGAGAICPICQGLRGAAHRMSS